jgi:hypothetical protein
MAPKAGAGQVWKGDAEGPTSSTTLASSADVVAAVLGGPAFASNRLGAQRAHTAAADLSADLEPRDIVAGHSALGALRPTDDEDTEDSVADISAPFNLRHLAHVEADASAACGFRGLPAGWMLQLMLSVCLASLVRTIMFLVPLAAAAALDSFCDVAVPVLASSLEHGHEAVAMPAVMNEAKKSCTTTIIKFMLVQAASMLCLFASRARQFTSSPRTPDDMTISPPSDFRHILHVGAGDARGIAALQQMVATNEMVSSPFNLLHTVHIDSRLCVFQSTCKTAQHVAATKQKPLSRRPD